MDPILSKLLNLWELNESTLNGHSLPANEQIFSGSYPLCCDDVSPLRDSVSNTLSTANHASTNPSERGQQCSELISCEQCNHINQDNANWCMECGSAIRRARADKLQLEFGSDCSSPSDLSPVLLRNHVDQTTKSKFPDCEDPVTPIFTNSYSKHMQRLESDVYPQITYSGQCVSTNHQFISDSMLSRENQQTKSSPKSSRMFTPTSTIKPSHVRTPNDSYSANLTTYSSWLMSRRDKHRHWSSSGAYMWRKPSSIQKSSHVRLTGNLSSSDLLSTMQRKSDVEPPLPVLNLSAIQTEYISSSENTSTIGSCTNTVRTTTACVI